MSQVESFLFYVNFICFFFSQFHHKLRLAKLSLNLLSWLDYIDTTPTRFNFKLMLGNELGWEFYILC
jgi:hypothetical protein